MILLTAAFTKMNLVLSGHTQRADMANRTDINENFLVGEKQPPATFSSLHGCGSVDQLMVLKKTQLILMEHLVLNVDWMR